MNETIARRLTGLAGIAAAAGFIVEVPLYFLYSGPPPDSNVLSRLLIGIVALAALILFVTGFRELVKQVDPACEWIGTAAFATGLVYATITLVSSGLEAGAVIAADHPIDPTITVSGTYILYGSTGRLLLALFLTAASTTPSSGPTCSPDGPAAAPRSSPRPTWPSYRPCSSATPPTTSTQPTAGAAPP